MHAHRTAEPPDGAARRDTTEFEHERYLLLELAIEPEPEGDTLAALAPRLHYTLPQLEAAAGVLERLGVLERREGRVRATTALRAVEHYWPLAL